MTVGHNLASRNTSRQTLWIPTIETADFSNDELQRDDFMIHWKQLVFREIQMN
jgi:hypothetical protein